MAEAQHEDDNTSRSRFQHATDLGHPALPPPDTDRLVPAARKALSDTQNPIAQRDRYEIENLLDIHNSIRAPAEIEYYIGRRLQLLLTARVHGWAFARKVLAYEEAQQAGIYALPPPIPATPAPRPQRGFGRRGGGRGRGHATRHTLSRAANKK